MLIFRPILCWSLKTIRLTVLLLALLCPVGLAARSLHKAGVQLANNAVLAMYQDQAGDMWIGTYDGLHLYNGKNTFVYRMELDNENSLCSNIVLKITPAESGYLWVTTSLGINKFSLRERRVVESYLQYVDVRNIVADADGNTICFANPDFISCYRPGTPFFEDVYFAGVTASEVAALWAEQPGMFCALMTDGRVECYRFEASKIPCLTRISQRQLSEKPIRKAVYHQKQLYLLDSADVLWRYDCSDDRLALLSDLSALGDMGRAVSMVAPFDGAIYVGFYAGAIGRIPAQGGRCELVGSDYRVFCLLPDRNQDILWVGTDGYGVHMYCDKDEMFTTLLMEELPQKIRKPVRAMYTDQGGDLWIGTKGDGVVRIRGYAELGGGKVPAERVTRFDRRDGLVSNEVFGFCPSARRQLVWFSSTGPGLSYYSYRDDRIRTLPQQAGAPDICSVHCIREVNDSTLYLASDTEGLVELILTPGDEPCVRSQQTYRFRMGNRDCNEFYSMLPESDSTLLLAMRGGYGLIRFNLRTKEYGFVDMHLLQSRALGDLLSLCQSRESGLYCGASSGLIRITPQGDIRQFDARNGMLNDMIHGVLEDLHGCIWLSTNKGLTQYNPRHDYFYNYSAPELQVFEFCDDAYWKCPYTNRLFFGGVNGVVWIDPASEPALAYKPQLRFMDVELSDGSVIPLSEYPGEGRPAVRIPPGTTAFSVSFVAADYLYGDNYEYSYRFAHSGDVWTELQKNNRVTFTGLPPGKYELQVRYKSNVMDQTNRVYTLPVTVLPPWYRTTVAIVGYIVLALGAVWLAVGAVRRHYRRQQQRVVAHLEEQQREKLSEARLNFFVNISHELCTPLTLINGMNERIARLGEQEPELQKYTEVMAENVRGLNDLVQEILDFRKIEQAGFGRVRISRTEVAQMLSTQVRSFSEAAERSGVELQFETSPALIWNTDAAFLRKIVANLVSNALKYTPREGYIRVSVGSAEGSLLLKVYNTGRGIASEHLEGVFDRYRILDTMDRSSYGGTASRNGLGLFICRGLVQALSGEIGVRSEVGRFAEFIVRLPWLEVTQEESASQAVADERPSGRPRNNEKPSLLVVDDNKDIIWLIESALADRFRICACQSVEQARARLAEMTPDLIVTDVVMEGTSGLELIASVRGDKFLRGIPIIVVSGRTTESEQAEGLDVGADAYLTKPFSVQVLSATVDRLIESRRVLKEYYNTPESVYTVVEGQKMHQTEKAFMDQTLAVVEEFIESENLRMEVLAERLGLTARNFYRKFKKITGRTPSDFVKDYRFEYAARLLTTTELTVQEIMYKVGISNKSYFYREFQKKYGFKPKEFRSKR